MPRRSKPPDRLGHDVDYLRLLKEPGLRGSRVMFVGRGEIALYQEDDRALLLEAFPGFGIIVATSIRSWDDGTSVTDYERSRIVEQVAREMRRLGVVDVKIV